MEKKELTPEELEELKNRHIRSFVLRRGHISNAQKRALEEELPQYAVEYSASPLDFASVFGRKAPVVLEIGCGMGETTAAIAAAHPEVNFLGCEVFAAGVGALAKRLAEQSLTNVRIIRHDAVEVVRDMIPDSSLAGEQMVEVLSGEPKLKNLYDGFSPVMGNPIAQRPQTKFQARGERLGHGIWDLVFTRI